MAHPSDGHTLPVGITKHCEAENGAPDRHHARDLFAALNPALLTNATAGAAPRGG